MGRRKKRTLISQREFARRLGVSVQAVSCAIKAGRISTVNGKIDPAVAKTEWEENTDQSKPRNRVTGSPKHRRDPDKPEEPMKLSKRSGKKKGSSKSTKTKPRKGKKRAVSKKSTQTSNQQDDRKPVNYAEARAVREAYNAKLARLKYEQQLGILVNAEEVRTAAFNLARRTRDELMGMPERIAAQIAATDDPAEVERILEDEIERVCQELSNADAVGT